MTNFEAVIGLEVHAQLLTESKIFCGCSTKFGAPPNENTCPICLGLPGALPVLNERAVKLGIRAAVALDCQVSNTSIFARKNYFYPDLPKGYQISQFDQPLATEGFLELPDDDSSRRIRIRRVHLEEDAGKLLHEGVEDASDSSYVDLNRSGVPLIEIVSEPDIRTPEEAHRYLMELRAILRYTEVSLANMEEGNLRCDANVSLRPQGAIELGTRVEIKNLNSFRNVQKALEYEISRQTIALNAGSKVEQETRLFHAETATTEAMRSKEEAHDYRYFPEPDLLTVIVHEQLLFEIQSSIPELPLQKRARFVSQYQLTGPEAIVLTSEPDLADFYEQAVRLSGESRLSANWILRDLLKKLNEKGLPIERSAVTPPQLAELITLVRKGAISSNQAKDVFEQIWETGRDPAQIVKEGGIAQVSDVAEISRFVDDVIRTEPELVKRYQRGEVKLQGVLVGLVMKATRGKANPVVVNELLKQRLTE
jgi:aspartyl-tRNA(Asn)/glutamyl-tRNA(Gln) amidotransferase subunit B